MAEQHPDSEESRCLVDRLRGGDRGALNQLFGRHEAYLRRMVGVRLDPRVRRRVSVSDVIQATHLDAVTRIDEFLGAEPAPFRWWLRKRAQERLRCVHREHLQTAKRAVGREVRRGDRSSLALGSWLEARESTPSRQVARLELTRRVRQALAELSDTDREILLMRNFENLPYREIAHILQLDAAAARMRYGRALVRLGKILRQGGVEEP